MAKKQHVEDNSKLYERSLEEVVHSSMIPYSEHIILERSIPRVEDGLKPVQRRILYTLYDLGITHDKPHKKSARVVGECLGKYHPHGDSSVYEAMVHMAQDFSMRMPLVDGQGNFGSSDGDPAAAMRYTEVRMNSLAAHLLRDLDKDTVKWTWNFDDTVKEPELLPARFPNLLVNGTQGIAIAMSSYIPTHNLGEVIDGTVALIDNSKISLDDMMKYIPGPDFPTGGYVVGGEQLKIAYETGKGRIYMKAKIHIEETDNDKQNIVITELPYQVKMSDVLTRLVTLRETQKDIFGGIQDILDESDRSGTRAVIKVKREVDAEKLVPMLYKKTDLQKTFAINMVAIADGKPRQMGIIEILKYYLAHQINVIVNRSKFDLKAAKFRSEIVKGLMIAIRNIDEVIRIIKGSPSTSVAKQTLRERFSLSEDQAQAILDMRLRALTGLEVGKLEEELAQLEQKIDYLTMLLGSKKEQYKVIRAELLEIKKQNKSARRSIILDKDDETVDIKTSEIEFKEGVLVHNINGTVKVVTPKNFSMSQTDISACGYEELSDRALFVNNRQTIYAFSNLGNCFRFNADELPDKKWREKGKKLAELSKDAQPDEKIVGLYSFDIDPQGEVLFYTAKGMLKRTSWKDLIVAKSAYKVVKLDDDEVIRVETVTQQLVLEITKRGNYIAFPIDEIPVQGRIAGGVKSVILAEDDALCFVGQMSDEQSLVMLTSNGKGKKLYVPTLEILKKRTAKGMKIFDLSEGAEIVYCGLFADEAQLAVIAEDGGIFPLSTEDVPIGARASSGRSITGDTITGAVYHRSTYDKP